MQPNSGAGFFKKGDLVDRRLNPHFLIEAKTAMTEKKSFAIKKEWLDTIKQQAFDQGIPYSALAFNFGGERNPDNYYIISESLFIRLKEFLEEENG